MTSVITVIIGLVALAGLTLALVKGQQDAGKAKQRSADLDAQAKITKTANASDNDVDRLSDNAVAGELRDKWTTK